MKPVAEPRTWRDVAVTEHEIELLRTLLWQIDSDRVGIGLDMRAALRQVIERWDANDAAEFTL